MSEILNSTIITEIVSGSPVTKDHSGLLAALNNRYPDTPFRIIQEYDGRTWDVGIINEAGNRVSDNLAKWIDQELMLTEGNAAAVWRKHKDSGLIRTERVGSALFLVAPFGPDPDMFFQLEILAGPEMTTQNLFDHDIAFPPEDRQDLIYGSCIVFDDNERRILSPARYKFEKLINARRFIRKLVDVFKEDRLANFPEIEKKIIHIQEIQLGPDGGQVFKDISFLDLCPNYLDTLPAAYRLFLDWSESSAGKSGHRFCDHWWLQTNEWEDDKGRRQYMLIPQWAEADGGLDLPIISPDWEASPFGVMESLFQFDQKAGYPFAWYFYMLHGNRVTSSAAGVVASAIRDGKMKPLPECDEWVLMRWQEESYGF
jgi:hypothetical protein